MARSDFAADDTQDANPEKNSDAPAHVNLLLLHGPPRSNDAGKNILINGS